MSNSTGISLTCRHCGGTKPLLDFSKATNTKSGRVRVCKTCDNQRTRARYAANPRKKLDQNARWAEANHSKRVESQRRCRARDPEKFNAATAAWALAHPERVREFRKKSQQRPEFKRKHAERARRWRAENPELSRARASEANARRREKNRGNPNFQLRERCRARIIQALKRSFTGLSKSVGTVELIGGSLEVFRQHIESLWLPGMTWETWSPKGWHIDHIRPCASFDLSDPAQQRECFHYTNTRPLWWVDNLTKGARYEKL